MYRAIVCSMFVVAEGGNEHKHPLYLFFLPLEIEKKGLLCDQTYIYPWPKRVPI